MSPSLLPLLDSPPDPGAASGPVSSPVPSREEEPVLGESLFKDALVRERRRADRSGTPFAVLLVDAGRASPGAGEWAAIQRAVGAVRRDVDAVGWLERGSVLGLLLAGVSARGAAEALQRVRREVARRLGDGGLSALSLRLYAHDDDAAPSDSSAASIDLLIEALIDERRRPWRDAAKRALDVAGSLALLLLFLPILAGVSTAVKWRSPGPVLFRQTRVGRRGEPFTMLKFRTMYVDAAPGLHQDYVSWFIKSSGEHQRAGGEVFKLTNDPRITPAGRFLRRSSLDELPQFWNVLRGDMSLVGPRPPLPFEVAQYQPWHRRRVLDAKPGVTGLWQVEGRSRTTFDEMVRLDLRYARTRTLWTDIKILAATPRAMLSGKGAC